MRSSPSANPSPGRSPDTSPDTSSDAPEAGALDLLLRLGRVHAEVARHVDRGLSAAHGLSLGDFVLLDQLGRAEGGRLRRIDLAEAVGMTASGVTRALGPLERIGLVEREANPRDARVAYASLTPTGREVLADAASSAGRVAIHLLERAGWTTADTEQLSGLLARLGG